MVQRLNLPARSHRLLPIATILSISASLQYSSVDSFAPTNPMHHHHHHHHHHVSSPTSKQQTIFQLHQSNNNIIDAEVIPDDELNNDDNNSNTATVTANQESSLIEYSQNQDPDWKSMPVAFCDTVSNSYIDCNLAFYVKDPRSGATAGAATVEYALGVPCEVPIVVALELEENDETREGDDGSSTVINLSKVLPINPDGNTAGSNIMKEEEKEEIFQLAARALMDEFGPSIRLKKTPRALTMEGDLEEVIGDWREVLLGNVGSNDGDDGKEKVGFSFEDALNLLGDDDDEDDNEGEGDYFDTIMKRDLGEDYMKLVEDEDDDYGVDEELLKLFDLAGLDGSEDLQELMDDVTAKEQNIKDASYEQLVQQLAPSAALKLLNFLGPGGKEYTILRPLRPILLVGKEDPEDYTRRILLTEEEEFEILPRLESACREGLEKAGFFLSSNE